MAQKVSVVSTVQRLAWVDIAKGIGILWVVFFHFVTNYIDTDSNPDLPSPTSGHFIQQVAGLHGWDSAIDAVQTLLRVLWFGVSELGFHAVGLFIMLGGWSLAATTWRRFERGPVRWGNWYKQRFLRLYPMYWAAHLLLILMPFTWLEPIDGRFLISLTGLRWINVESNFVYGNAAWWYFAMLIQLYAVFPLLFLLLRRFGVGVFLILSVGVGLATRHLLLIEWQSNGLWLLGANCLSRLPEFALGMALGVAHFKDSARVERWILGPRAVLAGLVLYYFVSCVYGQALSYVFADLYTAVSCSLVVIGVSGLMQRSLFLSKWIGLVGTYSFGLYLTHQPLVTWLGPRVRGLGMWQFGLLSAGLLWSLSFFGILLERTVNGWTERVLLGRKPV